MASGDGRTETSVLDVRIHRFAPGDAPVLGDIAFALKPRETLALTGRSGIGKTSLLRIIAGLERGYQGRCRAPESVAMVFQEPTLLPWRTLRDNISITTGASRDAAEDALAEVGLAGRGGDFPGQLSLGQQRRLALARAFSLRPQLLLLDEPFVSLDKPLAHEMMELFARLRAAHHVATILVTHAEEEAKALADRIIRLGGAPAEIVEEVQNSGAYFQLSASGVTSSRS